MYRIADLVKEKAEELQIQIIKAIPMNESDISWIRCKNKINELPANYEEVVKKTLAKNSSKVTRKKITGGDVTEVEIKIEGFDCELYILETTQGDIKKAEYHAWNSKKGNAYIRNLLDLPI